MKGHSGLETWLLMPRPHHLGAQDSCIEFCPSWTRGCGLTAYSGGIHFIWYSKQQPSDCAHFSEENLLRPTGNGKAISQGMGQERPSQAGVWTLLGH